MAQSDAAPRGENPIQLYSLGTPNGHKISIALELLGLKYDAHTINIGKGEQFQPWFLEISPNNRIPALVDYSNPAQPIKIFESGAILIYLAETYDKSGKLLPKSGAERYNVLQWLMWQMGGLGPMTGQAGHFFRYAPMNKELTEENLAYGKKRYLEETQRLFKVLNKQLQTTGAYVAGNNITIADLAIYPWVKAVINRPGEENTSNPVKDAMKEFTAVAEYVKKITAEDYVKRGLEVNKMS